MLYVHCTYNAKKKKNTRELFTILSNLWMTQLIHGYISFLIYNFLYLCCLFVCLVVAAEYCKGQNTLKFH
jgi:hypothetical protein